MRGDGGDGGEDNIDIPQFSSLPKSTALFFVVFFFLILITVVIVITFVIIICRALYKMKVWSPSFKSYQKV